MTRTLRTLALVLAMCAMAFPSPVNAAGANDEKKAQAIVEKTAGLFARFKSRVVKTEPGEVVISVPHSGLMVGSLTRITGADGSSIVALARVKSVSGDTALCAVLYQKGKIEPGKSRATGISNPVRALLIEKSGGEGIIGALEEAFAENPAFDIVPLELTQGAGAKASVTSPGKIAQSVKADFAFVISVEASKEASMVKITAFSPDAGNVAELTMRWTADKAVASHVAGQDDEKSFSISAGAGAKAGFLQKGSGAATHQQKEATRMAMDIRDRLSITKYQVDGEVASATWVKTGADGRALAMAVAGSLRIVTPENGRLKTIWETRPAGSPRILSVMAFDTDGDGMDEIFVNAAGSQGFESFVVEREGQGFAVKPTALPYYFSSTGGSLLAQKGMEEHPVATGQVFTVRRTGRQDYFFAPAFTLKGGEAPTGISRADLDGDGVMEIIGISSRGLLMIYNQSGALAWKGAGFGVTGKNIAVEKNFYLPVYPRILPVADSQAGLTLAVAASEYKPGGFLDKGGLEKSSIKFVQPAENGYTVEDRLLFAEGWISDIVEDPAAATAKGSVLGYALVIPGSLGDKSEIYLPNR
ncbi:MAG: VCBS repeat-containing protein [Nitrospinae bacterium]|nr:VCBS repeat-containing protein [Nitrospinota bacterium]